MAGNISFVGKKTTSGGMLTPDDFLATLLEYQSNEVAFEENLNRLKITNIQNLGTMRKKLEANLLEVVKQANKAQVEKWMHDKKEAEKQLNDHKKELINELADAEKESALKAEEIRHKARLEAIKAEAIVEEKYANKKSKRELEATKKKLREAGKAQANSNFSTIFGKGSTISERADALGDLFTTKIFKKVKDEYGNEQNVAVSEQFSLKVGLMNLTTALSSFAARLDTQIDNIAGRKSAIDTRLQGSRLATKSGSYWEKMSSDITGIAGVSPLVKQSDIASRISTYVGQGIAFNVEQRAILQEVAGKIADTFDAADGTLLRLVRIQQQDTTAGRLGMESALTEFLNSMYETTEYMTGTARAIKDNLNEAMSLMTGENALSFEYQIQKWLGSLYSVGMSNEAVQGIGGVLGKLASGQLEALTQGGQGNLVVMSAQQAGLNISDILTQGLNQETTNELLASMVEYLAKIYNEAGSSKVIQQQFAQVYGLSASDLKAALNLSKSTGTVSTNGLSYAGAMGRLTEMAGSMHMRTSIGELMGNAWDNLNYTMAAGVANNPALYGLYKVAGLLKDVTGGIEFGTPLIAGSGMTQTFNVADIMRTSAMAGGIVSSLVSILKAGSGGGVTGNSILKAAGISDNISQVTRGKGLGLSTTSGLTVSSSGGFIGNASDSDITQSTMTNQADINRSQTVTAADEAEQIALSDINQEIVAIYDILKNIASGGTVLNVAVPSGLSINNLPERTF